MRLPFPVKEQSYGAMTPLKQVVAVKRKEEEAPKASAPAIEKGSQGEKKAGEEGEVTAEGRAVDEVASKLEGLSVDAAAGKA